MRRRSRRLLLADGELTLVVRNVTQLRWGDYEQEKREFLARSRRQRRFTHAMAAITTALVTVSIGLGWYSIQAAQHRSDLRAWGLPGELYDKQTQLETLTVETSTPITNLKWLRNGLKNLSLSEVDVSDLTDLPQSLQSLSIGCGKISNTGPLPVGLTEVSLGIPGGVGKCRDVAPLSAGLVEFPPRIRVLRIRCPFSSLRNLPLDLSELQITPAYVHAKGKFLQYLRMDSEVQKTFRIPVNLVSLETTPEVYEELSKDESLVPNLRTLKLKGDVIFRGWTSTKLQRLPETLERLEIDDYGGKIALPKTLPQLKSVKVWNSMVTSESLEHLPISLKSLSLVNSGEIHNSSVPRYLSSLELSDWKFIDIKEVPSTVQELDYSGPPMDLRLLPRTLRRFTFHLSLGSSTQDLRGLPETLEELSIYGGEEVLCSLAGTF